ncbi:MAG: hypothetical protein ACI30K_06560 [Muribaculaceae bacterium]
MAALMGIIWQSAYAERPIYSVMIPQLSKIVQSTGDNVNLRKSPSTTAPKLTRVCEAETDICSYTWSNDPALKRKGTDSYVERAMKGYTYIVVDEMPEWYGIVVGGLVAYISKQFAKPYKCAPVTPEMLQREGYFGYDSWQKPGFSRPDYRSFALVNTDGFETFGYYFARIIDGFLVLSHEVHPYISFNNESRGRLKVTNDAINYGSQLLTQGENGSYFDCSKLTEAEIETLMKHASTDVTATTCVILGIVDGNLRPLATVNANDLPASKRQKRTY